MVNTNIQSHHSVFPNDVHQIMTYDSVCEGSQANHSRTQALDKGIQRLQKGRLPGTHHAQDYLHHKYRLNLRARTITSTISFLISFLSFLKAKGTIHLETLTREDIEAFIEHLQDLGLKASTISSRVKQMKALVRFLIEEDIVSPQLLFKRLTVKVPEPLPRAIPPDELRSLLAVIDEIRNKAMILVLLRTGMRIGEPLSITVSEVIIEEKKILIFEAEKNRLGRVVYFSDDARDALSSWLKVRDPQRQYLFYARRNENMSYSTARMMFNRYLIKAGLGHKGYSLHSLRHTFATELLNAGMRLECLQVLLGHASLQMTRRYARLSDKSRQEEYFRAMRIIEKEEGDEYYQLDCELQAILEEEKLLAPYCEELSEPA